MQQIHQRNSLGHAGTGCVGAECKPHQCQQCMKSFSSNHQLVQHIRVHTGEKPYKCSYCERRFKQLSHVQQHTRLHTETSESVIFGCVESHIPTIKPYLVKGMILYKHQGDITHQIN
ncbi:hypothetical protein FF38_05183 [Lucilia cuprina]|uniref:C2H2-type domain-containing protein n=1 Tax=Lucilia cuprina TaxID=7375 RepID=A0A0L0BVU6_LUCCU|nr:hypothetical protein FF38_05183 [Lucilia cuprina]